MKKIIRLLILLIFNITLINAQNTTDKKDVMVFGNDHYNVSSTANQYKINIDKEPWESFAIQLQASSFKNKTAILDMAADRFANVKIYMLKTIEGAGAEVELNTLSINKDAKHVLFDLNNPVFENKEEILLIIYIEPGYKWNGLLLLKIENLNNAEIETNSIVIAPNPARDVAMVTCEGVKEGTYKLYDVNGKLIAENNAMFTNDSFKLDVSGIASGTYLFVLYANDAAYKSKLIITNSKKQ